MRKPSVCHPDKPNYARGQCYTCWKREWYRNRTPEQVERDRLSKARRYLKRRWGLTPEQVSALNECQGGCAICHSDSDLEVDHDHKTEQIRGLLCSSCNLGLGKFYDNEVLLRRAADYLEDRKCEVGS